MHTQSPVGCRPFGIQLIRTILLSKDQISLTLVRDTGLAFGKMGQPYTISRRSGDFNPRGLGRTGAWLNLWTQSRSRRSEATLSNSNVSFSYGHQLWHLLGSDSLVCNTLHLIIHIHPSQPHIPYSPYNTVSGRYLNKKRRLRIRRSNDLKIQQAVVRIGHIITIRWNCIKHLFRTSYIQ